ncbi:MAG TPA: tetratricopeptide repeat protein [Blastocatellia bacterium]|nr:tetratricopeptide repeat protein [Blastocatellia bacterium]
MVLSVNNCMFWHFIRIALLVFIFSLSIFSQDSPPTLEAALATNDPAARLEALQKFLQAQPDAPQADAARAELTRVYAYLGETQLGEKNVDGAIQNFKQAIAAFPKQVDDKFFEEVALRIPLAVSVRGYRTEAILLARAMEARFGAEANRLASLGEFYLSLEAPTEALRALHSATKLTPDNARIYRLLGAAHRVNLNLDKAAEQFTAAIKADPKDSRAYFELANLQRARGRYEVAINLYNHQLSLEPEHAPSIKGLALCHIAQGKEDRANELLAQAAKVTNTDLARDYYLQTQLALAYLARGNVAKARQAANAALAAEPRFSWARIAAAEVELAEGKYFEAERNIIAAMKYADFPTLHFTLGKIYLAVEDFEGALEEFGKAFSFKAGKFHTRLGGVQEISEDTVAELLATERQASLFQAEPITTDVEFKLAENLARFDTAIRRAKLSVSQLPSALILNQKNNQVAVTEIEKTAENFVETEGSRKPYRWLYAAERLTQAGQALETAVKLTDEALDAAEAATAPEGSLRDYPNYDRDGRLRVFRGRALTLRGRALIKLNRPAEAITTLEQAIESYGPVLERNRAQWQLALAKESAGQAREALDLYIAAYEPPDKSSVGADLNRTVIEALYRKVNGSLDGLNERIGKAREAALAANANSLPLSVAPENSSLEKTETEKKDSKPAENPPTEPAPTTTTTVTADTTTKPETTPGGKPVEEVAATNATTPVALPEARLLTLVTEDLARTELSTESLTANLAADEDAPPPVLLAATNETSADKPTNKSAEEANTVTGPVILPESRLIALALMTEELPRIELQHELSRAAEDAPWPTKAVEATTATTIAAATTDPKEETKLTATPITLPDAVMPSALLAVLEVTAHEMTEPTVLLEEVEDPAPPAPSVSVAAKTSEEDATTPGRNTSAPEQTKAVAPTEPSAAPSRTTNLSDARVAEIEKMISGGTAPGGKKGDSKDALEEAASGHIEGDAPVRISKPATPVLEPVLPAGETGRVLPTTPKVNGRRDEPATEGLPSEVEARAKAMGQSAGKLSAGAAMEVDVPERPAGGGRKGTRKIDEPEKEPTPTPNARPRRVKEEGPKPKPPNQ